MFDISGICLPFFWGTRRLRPGAGARVTKSTGTSAVMICLKAETSSTAVSAASGTGFANAKVAIARPRKNEAFMMRRKVGEGLKEIKCQAQLEKEILKRRNVYGTGDRMKE